METIANIARRLKEKLTSVGIPYKELDVFGATRINVHVTCIGRKTADRWASLLNRVFAGAKASPKPTILYTKENTGSCLLPSTMEGYRISIVGWIVPD